MNIIKKLFEIETRNEGNDTCSWHDDIVQEFAHEVAYLMEQNLNEDAHVTKSDARLCVEKARENIKTMLLQTLGEAEASFIEELG